MQKINQTCRAADAHWESVKNKLFYDLSIIIPAYNEEKRIGKTLDEIAEYISKIDLKTEIIVVNDGSRDRTSEVVKKNFQKYSKTAVSLIDLEYNQGKGKAIKSGVLASRGKLVLFSDADGSTPIKELERLLKDTNTGSDVVIASRAKPSEETKLETVWYRKYLGRCFNLAVNLLILPGFYDTQCGFKLFTAKAAQNLFFMQTINGFAFDLEILYLAKKLKYKISEVPVNWYNVPGSKVNLVSDSLKMLKDVFYIRGTWR